MTFSSHFILECEIAWVGIGFQAESTNLVRCLQPGHFDFAGSPATGVFGVTSSTVHQRWSLRPTDLQEANTSCYTQIRRSSGFQAAASSTTNEGSLGADALYTIDVIWLRNSEHVVIYQPRMGNRWLESTCVPEPLVTLTSYLCIIFAGCSQLY